jgi:Uma2 family endonuclease
VADDGIVVGEAQMLEKKTVESYLSEPESMRPSELVYGFVREPPAPNVRHQTVVTHLTALLHQHVRTWKLGVLCVSPVDVVLDRERALIVQPDIVFVSTARAAIVRDRIWGAPDLVVEVLSPGTARRDRTVKLGWYREYGVRECWLVDAGARQIDVHDLSLAAGSAAVSYRGRDETRSTVLTDWRLSLTDLFDLY